MFTAASKSARSSAVPKFDSHSDTCCVASLILGLLQKRDLIRTNSHNVRSSMFFFDICCTKNLYVFATPRRELRNFYGMARARLNIGLSASIQKDCQGSGKQKFAVGRLGATNAANCCTPSGACDRLTEQNRESSLRSPFCP